jgi:hypothetical protein
MCSAMSASSAFGGRRCGIRRICSNRRAQSLPGTRELTDDDD